MANMFRSERLVYRAIEQSDMNFIQVLHQDAGTQLATTPALPVPQGQQHARAHLAEYASCMLSAIICLARSDSHESDDESDDLEPMGIITLRGDGDCSPRHFQNAKFGIALTKRARGKGYGTEAVKWMLEWAFRQAALHKVATYVYEFNKPSINMCEKLGFKLDGRLRNEVWNDGRYWDDMVFSMLEGEWRALYGEREGKKT